MYVFPGSAEDISAAYQSENYKMYFSKYTLLNFPKENLVNIGGTQASITYFDFGSFSTIAPSLASDYKDRVVESLRNYVANHEIVLRESRLNNTEYYYDTRSLETTSEKIFWKWCKKLNLIDFQAAVPSDEYFENLPEFERINLTDDSYFPEYLWKEREIVEYNVSTYEQSSSSTFPNNVEINITSVGNFRIGDIIELISFDPTNQLASDVFGSSIWATVSTTVLDVIISSGGSYSIIVDIETTASTQIETTAKVRLVYHKLIQYIGEVNGISNVQEANKAYTEVYAHIPDHTGQTPDILFRTIADSNYKPGLQFPIIPSQYQPEIFGAELFSSPIVSNPTEYPGSQYGQFDTIDFTYEVQGGDSLRRSGLYYGVSGDINDPVVNGSTIDGVVIDFDTSHYSKMNINDREVSTFDEFNALEINNSAPIDFEFNAILWYYTVEDTNGNKKTNLYGISFLDNPDNNPVSEDIYLRFPTYKKLVTNGNQDGTSYAFSLNLNFNIINDNPQESYNPEAINSLFSMNLFNEAMRRLSSVNDSFMNILGQQTDLQTDLLNVKKLLYSQTDLALINTKISNLENLLKLYSTQQISSSDTVQVEVLDTSPSQIRLNNIDTNYYSIDKYLTSNMYDFSGSIPVNVTPPNNKNFLVNIINNDEVDISLPDNKKLNLLITKDLEFKQSIDILITGSDLSTQNKKMDVYITTMNALSGTASTLPVETLLIGDIDLPVFYNSSTSQPNSASTWKNFNFDIDFNKEIKLLSGNFLQLNLDNNPLIVSNSVKSGDSIVLNNLFIGTVSTFDFSGQYKVENVVGATVSININSNNDFVSYASGSYPLIIHDPSSSILANSPFISLNKGFIIRVTRINAEDNISLSEKYLIDIRDLQY